MINLGGSSTGARGGQGGGRERTEVFLRKEQRRAKRLEEMAQGKRSGGIMGFLRRLWPFGGQKNDA